MHNSGRRRHRVDHIRDASRSAILICARVVVASGVRREPAARARQRARAGSRGKRPAGLPVEGRRDDPFFIDLIFVRGVLNLTPPISRLPGKDLFIGLNVSIIIIEVPAAMLRGTTGNIIRNWGTTSRTRATTRSRPFSSSGSGARQRRSPRGTTRRAAAPASSDRRQDRARRR